MTRQQKKIWMGVAGFIIFISALAGLNLAGISGPMFFGILLPVMLVTLWVNAFYQPKTDQPQNRYQKH